VIAVGGFDAHGQADVLCGLPGFVGGVNEDRREQLGQRGEDVVHRRLAGAAADGVLRVAVHPVLGRVDVDRGQVGGAELVHRVEDLAEFILLVGLAALGDDGVEPFEDPLVEQRQVARRDPVHLRIEAVEIA